MKTRSSAMSAAKAAGAASPEERIGTVVGDRYRIERLLGQGGMGTAYQARHTLVGRRVALKFLNSDLAERQDMLARFRREARVAGELENNHIAAVFDFGLVAGVPYLVMAYLRGQPLSLLLATHGPLPVARDDVSMI